MTLNQLQSALVANPGSAIHLMLPDGSFVPPHFHITEVGRVQKDFIDCGGTVRSLVSCMLQVWVADDRDHRLDTSRLNHILELGGPVLKTTELPVEVEYQSEAFTQYQVTTLEVTPSGILLELGHKHTDCLAPDKCGPVEARSCCGPSGCC